VAVSPGASSHWQTVLELARRLPEVEEGTSYATPALRVRGRFFARLREDGETLVVKMNLFERQYLVDADPEVFFITDHYRDYPSVLVRLPAVQPAQLAERLEDAWRIAAPKRLAAAFDART
jgi:hypothetical protein